MVVFQKPNKYVYMYRDIHGPSLHNDESAREFVYALSQTERGRLTAELQKFIAAESTGE
jgi:hypothetical protein